MHPQRMLPASILSDVPLTNLVPLCRTKEGDVATQFDGDALQRLGFIQQDILGLNTLKALQAAIGMIEKAQRKPFSLLSIPLDDPQMYALVNSGDTDRVFQLEGSGMRDLVKSMGVRSIEDLAIAIALSPPETMNLLDDLLEHRLASEADRLSPPALEPLL